MTKKIDNKSVRRIQIILFALVIALAVKIFIPIAAAYYPQLNVRHPNTQNEMATATVYLTYDDGPGKNTEKLLDILKAEEVSATFFVIGSEVKEYERLYRRIVSEGHTVGLHSYSHKYKEIYATVDAYLKDLAKLDAMLYDYTEIHAEIMRFPGGSCNSFANTDMLAEIIAETEKRGYIYYDWNVVSGDDTPTLYAPEVLFQNVVRGAKGKESIVVLFHDSENCTTTPEATRLVIDYFKSHGYSFAALNKTVKPIRFAEWKKRG